MMRLSLFWVVVSSLVVTIDRRAAADDVGAKPVAGVSVQVTPHGIDRFSQDLTLSEAQRSHVDRKFAAYQQALAKAVEQNRDALTDWQIKYLVDRYPDLYGDIDPMALPIEQRRNNPLAMGIMMQVGDEMVGADQEATIAQNAAVVALGDDLAEKEKDARKQL